ncbi:MAG: rhomboid family intramembrane serine protease, partial [Akkermansiaceae bacterium]|nr:rhomboid family intramembrane serine protease [Akkermansiaceae bacterium]
MVREGHANSGDFLAFGTLLSCAFLHADATHLLYNMLFLWLFAALTVQLLG